MDTLKSPEEMTDQELTNEYLDDQKDSGDADERLGMIAAEMEKRGLGTGANQG